MKEKNIKNLLDKFINKGLDREELDFVYHSINHNLHEEDIKALFYRYWDESELKSKKIKSIDLLEKIRENISRNQNGIENPEFSKEPSMCAALKAQERQTSENLKLPFLKRNVPLSFETA